MNLMKKLTLAIDTCIDYGSFSIYQGDSQINYRIGDKSRPLSVDILPNISEMLSEINMSINDIKQIVYTNGPGSYTGIRVGLASIFGLSKACGCDLIPLTVFEAFSFEAEQKSYTKALTAIQIGNYEVALQEFDKQNGRFQSGKGGGIISLEKFKEYILDIKDCCLISDRKLSNNLRLFFDNNILKCEWITASDNVSSLAVRYFNKYGTKTAVVENYQPYYGREYKV